MFTMRKSVCTALPDALSERMMAAAIEKPSEFPGSLPMPQENFLPGCFMITGAGAGAPRPSSIGTL